MSRKQHPFTVSVADLTREADNCLLLETLALDPTLGIGGPELRRVSSAQFGGEGGDGLHTGPLVSQAASLKPPRAETGVRTYQ